MSRQSTLSSKRKKRLRQRMFDSYPFCCICGKQFNSVTETTIEHIIPLAKGGSDRVENLGIAHESCNNKKGSKEVRMAAHPIDLGEKAEVQYVNDPVSTALSINIKGEEFRIKEEEDHYRFTMIDCEGNYLSAKYSKPVAIMIFNLLSIEMHQFNTI